MSGHGQADMPQDGQLPFDTSSYDRTGADWLDETLAERALLMQGPMGSALMSQPGGQDVPAAYWNLGDPQEVSRLHWLYRAAGADLMLTNTFQANESALARDEIADTVERVNSAAVNCAKRAGAPCVLGSMGSNGIFWLKEDSEEYRRARAAYRRQAYALLASGAHGIMLETFTALRDLEAAIAGTSDVADGMPVLVSFAIGDEGNLLGDGLNIEAACMRAQELGAYSVGINCCSIEAATQAVPRMARATDLPVSVRPNAGYPHRGEDGSLMWHEDPQAFARACEQWCADGARIVGSCCGAGVLTTCTLAGVLDI